MSKPLFYFIILFNCNLIFSQQKVDTYETSLDSINTIVVILRDETVIKTSMPSNTIVVNAKLFIKGWVIGWRERKRHNSFLINSHKSNDTLFVESPKHKGGSYGVSFGASEKITTAIEIPKNKEVIIREAEDVETYGGFKKLIAENVDRLELNGINKKSIQRLACMSEKIKVDGNRLNSNYRYEGSGTAVYKLEAKKIIINNLQFH